MALLAASERPSKAHCSKVHPMTKPFLTISLFLSLTVPVALAQTHGLSRDSEKQAGVPEGKISEHSWTSKIYPGTVRDYWVYVPAQYDGSKPAAVMIFQDGRGMKNTEGERAWMTPVVLDNLIYKGEMPVTIGIFIDPGVLPAKNDEQEGRYNRSFEYDAIGDRYARFLLEEILPEVGKTYKLTDDPNLRGISGSSSGGIAAFTAAWNRPDAFRRVLSFIGSYTDLRGGNVYPAVIRKTEPKPSATGLWMRSETWRTRRPWPAGSHLKLNVPEESFYARHDQDSRPGRCPGDQRTADG
jgi:enterochelin esterase family protein